MLVKEVIAEVMRMTGRPDVAEQCAGQPEDNGEADRMQRAMLLCLNAVADELARGYFPVSDRQTLTPSQGKIYYTSFTRMPYRVRAVRRKGRSVPFRAYPKYIECGEGSAEVEYEYIPERLTLSDEFAFPHPSVGHTLVEYGVAAEYMLIAGDVGRARFWEEKYRAEIDRQLSLLPAHGNIPPRRWI